MLQDWISVYKNDILKSYPSVNNALLFSQELALEPILNCSPLEPVSSTSIVIYSSDDSTDYIQLEYRSSDEDNMEYTPLENILSPENIAKFLALEPPPSSTPILENYLIGLSENEIYDLQLSRELTYDNCSLNIKYEITKLREQLLYLKNINSYLNKEIEIIYCNKEAYDLYSDLTNIYDISTLFKIYYNLKKYINLLKTNVCLNTHF